MGVSWYDSSSMRAIPGALDYLGAYAGSFTQALPEKLGVGALVAVLATGHSAFTELFWALLIFWAADMVTGTLRAFRDPSEKLERSRAMDGLTRLLILVIFPPLVAVAELFSARMTGFDPDGKLVVFAMGVLAVQELISVTRNVEYFYPGVKAIRGKLIRWREGEAPTSRPVRAIVIDDDRAGEEDERDDDEDGES